MYLQLCSIGSYNLPHPKLYLIIRKVHLEDHTCNSLTLKNNGGGIPEGTQRSLLIQKEMRTYNDRKKCHSIIHAFYYSTWGPQKILPNSKDISFPYTDTQKKFGCLQYRD